MEVAFSTEARSSASVFRFLRALSLTLKMAYPAAVSARMKTILDGAASQTTAMLELFPPYSWLLWTARTLMKICLRTPPYRRSFFSLRKTGTFSHLTILLASDTAIFRSYRNASNGSNRGTESVSTSNSVVWKAERAASFP